VVTLTHPRGTFSVLILAVELEPDLLFVDPSASGADPWYSGTITLQEV
jgi:ABC-type transporter Mla maintaining outer membrane lipid asymmetry ATPase subunit MlaF